MRFATGRPPWVLKATATVAVFAFAVPLVALVLLLVPAALLTAVAWFVFSLIARLIDSVTGQAKPRRATVPPKEADGRENVRIINRP